jgi:perosamine synthetase
MGVDYACAVSSGTAGLIMALQALGVKFGDEVITVSFTVPATVNSIVAIGAIPVMIDIETETFGLNPDELKMAINPKTKAIIVVHTFGKAAQIRKIMTIANEHNIKVIEDACEAIGNKYQDQYLGSIADIGVFAFYPNKQITTGEGGMLITNNQDYHHQFKLLANHGRSMNGDYYDQISFGWNFRMSDINAALGLSQLNRLDKIIKKRQEIADHYHQRLSGHAHITTPKLSAREQSSAWFVYVVRLTKGNRDDVLAQLNQKGIACGRYFAPVHLQPYYLSYQQKIKLKNTEQIAEECLALPFYHQLQEQNIEYICNNLIENLK